MTITNCQPTIKRNASLKQSNTDLLKERCGIGCLGGVSIPCRYRHLRLFVITVSKNSPKIFLRICFSCKKFTRYAAFSNKTSFSCPRVITCNCYTSIIYHSHNYHLHSNNQKKTFKIAINFLDIIRMYKLGIKPF